MVRLPSNATLAALLISGCSLVVGNRLDDKPEAVDGGTDAGAVPDTGPSSCTVDDDCPGAAGCDVVCNAGECQAGTATGAQCGDTTNERCVAGTCRLLAACSPTNFECGNECQEICVPTSETAGVCILTTDIFPGLTADGYPCGPLRTDTGTGDVCYTGTCRLDVNLCATDAACTCTERCVIFADAEGGGCMPLGGVMRRPAGSPCTTRAGAPGTCTSVGACQGMDGT